MNRLQYGPRKKFLIIFPSQDYSSCIADEIIRSQILWDFATILLSLLGNSPTHLDNRNANPIKLKKGVGRHIESISVMRAFGGRRIFLFLLFTYIEKVLDLRPGFCKERVMCLGFFSCEGREEKFVKGGYFFSLLLH